MVTYDEPMGLKQSKYARCTTNIHKAISWSLTEQDNGDIYILTFMPMLNISALHNKHFFQSEHISNTSKT
jgi:hypothetical protein